MCVKPKYSREQKSRFRCLAMFLVLASQLGSEARVTQITIKSVQSPAYSGQSFGTVGTYEVITGLAHGELDPNDPHNQIITDLALAPTNAQGKVEYTATFTLQKPSNLAKGNGVMLYFASNRGNRISNGYFGVSGEAGNDFLLKRGYIILHSGWQGDLPQSAGTEWISVPPARNPDGSSVTGAALARFVNMANGTKTLSLPAYHPTASFNTTLATLTRRTSEFGPTMIIPASDWAFSDCSQTAFPGTPDANKVSVKGGFNSAYLYELSYTAKDPLVLGIGLAATRDIVSFFRYQTEDDAHVANPVAGGVTNVIGQGVSQAGNFVKTFIHLGFNQDEAGRLVWDGANPHIAGRQTPMNFRFAIPGGAATLYEPGSETTLWWGDYVDTARGQSNATSMLTRSSLAGASPKIFETFGAAEFWGLRMSPGLVGTSAETDIPLPANVRRYYFPGTTHGGGAGGFKANLTTPAGGYVLPANPNPQAETMRALLVALTDWVTKNIAPPPSVFPRLADGNLVSPNQSAMGFPTIPGKPLPDGKINPFYDYDFGPQFNYCDLSGVITIQPPVIKGVLPQLVPKVDADGNEISGVASALHQAPLGTYLGWNVRSGGFYQGEGWEYVGGFIPFAETEAERLATGDPRPSLQERYQNHAGYVAAMSNAVQNLVAGRFLLPEDGTNLVQQAQASEVLLHNDWTGATSSEWNDPANWWGDVFPTTSATIKGGLNVPVISSDPVFSVSNLYVGDGDSGELVLTNGNLTINGEFVVGQNDGAGTISQYGGNFVKSGGTGFMVGNGADQTGVFNLNGGTLTTYDLARIGSEPASLSGAAGNGTFNLTGGNVTCLNYWQIGRNYGAGTMNMTGGNFYQSAVQYFAIANSGSTGTFNMSGGNLYSTNQILVAYANGVAGSTGVWNLSGTANVVHGGTKRFAIGIGGNGTLNQSGGNFIYTVSGVAAEIGVLSTFAGTGLWNMSGGTAVLTNRLFIGDGTGSVGTLNLSGSATMTVSGIQLGVSSATGTLNLNGGTLTVNGTITKGTGSGTFNFNGGTLRAGASSATFLTNLTLARVNAAGAIIDTDTNAITIGQSLVNGGGGLIKSGPGVLTLAGANTYNGSVVSNGTLIVNGSVAGSVVVLPGATLGGNGSVGGIVNVQPGGSISAGTGIGKLTLNRTPILGGTVVAELNRNGGAFTNDLIDVGSNPLAYGGTLLVTNTGAALQVNDVFKLFNSASGYSGAFTVISRTPGQHVIWNISNLTVNGTIRVAAVGPPLPIAPTNMIASISNNLLNLAWPSNYTGWVLQSNGVGLGRADAWISIPGSNLTNHFIQPIDPSRTNVFFRMNLP